MATNPAELHTSPAGRVRAAFARLREMFADDVVIPDPSVSVRSRVLTAIAIGLASAALAYFAARREGAIPDFLYPWTGARLFLDGTDPYVAMRKQIGAAPPFDTPLFYPFTTLFAILPLARLDVAAAGAVFFGLSAAVLAFCITRGGLWRIHIFMSAPFVSAALLVQFSPLLTTVALVPALGFLATLKPNLGAVLLATRPSRIAVVGCVLFLALSVLVFPQWPEGWIENIRQERRIGVHQSPVLHVGGLLLLLAVMRWRLAAAGLLLGMSLIPQALFFYDQLPLWLLPRTRQQSILLTGCSQLAFILWFLLRTPGELIVQSAYPHVIALIYLPALLILLRQANSPKDGLSMNASAALSRN